MPKEIRTKDGLCNISYDENPTKGPSEPKAEGEGAGTKSLDRRAIDSLQGQACLWEFAFSAGR